jgi:hypothetical protein
VAVGEGYVQVVSKAFSSLPPAVRLPPVHGQSSHWKISPCIFQKTQHQRLLFYPSRSSFLALPFHRHMSGLPHKARGVIPFATRLMERVLANASQSPSSSISAGHLIDYNKSPSSHFLTSTGPVSSLTRPDFKCRLTAIRTVTTFTAQRCGFCQYPPCYQCSIPSSHHSNHHDFHNRNPTFHCFTISW